MFRWKKKVFQANRHRSDNDQLFALGDLEVHVFEDVQVSDVHKRQVPTLAVVRVGARPDDLSYEKGVMARCAKVGVEVKQFLLPADVYKRQIIGDGRTFRKRFIAPASITKI